MFFIGKEETMNLLKSDNFLISAKLKNLQKMMYSGKYLYCMKTKNSQKTM